MQPNKETMENNFCTWKSIKIYVKVSPQSHIGGVAEWSIALVLKTRVLLRGP